MKAVITPGRRVATFDDLDWPGDYTGPHPSQRNGQECKVVWFLLPIHRGDKFSHAVTGNGLHAVYEPPWRFRECEDGSLEIRESIGCGIKPDYYWHGYLDEGNKWRQTSGKVF